MGLYTILGAGGVVADELGKRLISEGEKVRLVSRTGHAMEGAEAVKADVSSAEQSKDAVKGSTVVFLCVGLKYDRRVWSEMWPRIMTNTIDACKRNGAKLVFFDNVYAYGRVDGPMKESTTYYPSSKKGEIRADIATKMMDEVKAGNMHGLIARAADFYGPFADKVGIPNELVFKRIAGGKKPNILARSDKRHSYTFTFDIAESLSKLAKSEEAYDQVWHLPTAADPPTGKEFARLASEAFGTRPAFTVLPKWMIKAGGVFDGTIYEISEMLYQNEFDYVFDSAKIQKAFGVPPTSYEDGVGRTAAYYRKTENTKG